MEFRNQDEDIASTIPSSLTYHLNPNPNPNPNQNQNQNQNSNPSSIRISPFSSPRPNTATSAGTIHPTHITSSRNGNSSPQVPRKFQLQPNSRTATDPGTVTGTTMYHECLRNHAAALGGHVVDGCGEFMPASEDPLKCAACTCHRSFHRKDSTSFAPSRTPLLLPPTHHHPYAYLNNPNRHFNSSGLSGGTTTESSSEERTGVVPVVPGYQTQSKKRFRTKFTPEQKEKMMAFAERIGWRIQKQEEHLVEQFCAETGLRRQVLKVWMHNNKHNVRKQDQAQLEKEDDRYRETGTS